MTHIGTTHLQTPSSNIQGCCWFEKRATETDVCCSIQPLRRYSMWSSNHIICVTIDVEAVYIDMESFYLFRVGVRKEGAQASYGEGCSTLCVLSATAHKTYITHHYNFLFKHAGIKQQKKKRLSAPSRPSVRISAAPGGQIFAHIWHRVRVGVLFMKNLSNNSMFG